MDAYQISLGIVRLRVGLINIRILKYNDIKESWSHHLKLYDSCKSYQNLYDYNTK